MKLITSLLNNNRGIAGVEIGKFSGFRHFSIFDKIALSIIEGALGLEWDHSFS